jgi:predicted Rossmann fold flavoprotein
MITGKGRCNVTNNCTKDEFFKNVPTNPRFLYSCYNSFGSQDVMEFFEGLGVPLKTERGNRVFPVSDRAFDIVDALASQVKGHVKTARVSGITVQDGAVTGVRIGQKSIPYDAVIVCTGGLSYKQTGSDGDGLKFAEQLGIETIPARPSLVPIESPDPVCREMQGLSLKNVSIRVEDENGKTAYTDFGEMMFTHFGVTGPMILSASSMIPDIEDKSYTLYIDMKPALDEKELDNRILSDFSKNINRDFINSLSALLPSKMIDVMVERSGIAPDRKVNSITREERRRLVELLKSFPVRLSGFRDINEAIITKGGVSVKELDPKTMECKKIAGLYFAGEVIDVDAYTGGFNLQIAFSTAAAAADAIAGLKW